MCVWACVRACACHLLSLSPLALVEKWDYLLRWPNLMDHLDATPSWCRVAASSGCVCLMSSIKFSDISALWLVPTIQVLMNTNFFVMAKSSSKLKFLPLPWPVLFFSLGPCTGFLVWGTIILSNNLRYNRIICNLWIKCHWVRGYCVENWPVGCDGEHWRVGGGP